MDTKQATGKPCKTCGRLLDLDARFCSCGAPTALASFKERSQYEVKLWRAYQERVREQTN